MAKKRKKSTEIADWNEVELLYVLSPEDVSFKTLARRLGINLNTFTSRATRGDWTAKRAAAKGASPSPGTPCATANGLHEAGDSGENTRECVPNQPETLPVVVPKKEKRGELAPTELVQSVALVQKARGEIYLKKMSAQAERLPELMAEMSQTELLTRSGDLDKLDKMNRRSLGLDTGENSNRAPLVQIALLSGMDRSTVPKVFPRVISATDSTDTDKV